MPVISWYIVFIRSRSYVGVKRKVFRVVGVLSIVFGKICLHFVKAGVFPFKLFVPNYSHVFDEVFDKYTTRSMLRRVKTTNMGTMYELTYSVSMKRNADEKEFIDHLRMRNGNLNITLGMAELDEGILN